MVESLFKATGFELLSYCKDFGSHSEEFEDLLQNFGSCANWVMYWFYSSKIKQA